MAPKATTAPTDGAEAEADLEPVNLDDIEAAGAVKAGRRPVRMVLVWEDGTRSSYALPVPSAAKDWTKTRVGRLVLSVLSAEDRPLKGESIAKLADYGYTGSFRQCLKGLEDNGEIERNAEGLYVLS